MARLGHFVQLVQLVRRRELGRRHGRGEEVTMGILTIIGAIVVIIVLKLLGLY